MNWLPGYDLNQEQKKVIILSALGGMLEFYDFTIYGLFAVYFASQIFPTHDPLIAIMASYAIFVVGYIIRPVGGIIFSHIGDESGRKKVLIMTMLLMGIASLGLGLVPTYEQVGIYAPIIMLGFRLLQGLAFGGEIPSMIVYTTESLPAKRGLGVGGSYAGTLCGLVLGMVVNFILVKTLNQSQLATYGWRIPFFIGGLLCFISYKVRRELQETNAFKNMKHNIKVPLMELLKNHLFSVLIGVGLVSIVGMAITLLIIFMPTYLAKIVKLNPEQVGNVVLGASIVATISIYITGILAQKLDLYKFTRWCLLLILLSSCLCYYLISINKFLYLGFVLFAVFEGALVTLPIIYLSYIFPTEVRLSGVALSYNISFVIFAGFTPLMVTWLIEKTGWIFYSPLILLFISIVFAYWSVRQAQKFVNSTLPT